MWNCAPLSCALILAFCATAFAQDESPLHVSLCELKADPVAYNHKTIVVQGTISHAFEDFSFQDPLCSNLKNRVWLTYGSGVPDNVLFCCNGTGNDKGRVLIEGIEVTVVEDANLKSLRELINSYRIDPKAKVVYFQTDPSHTVKATLRGRFFAGKPDSPFRGFGHMGCCTLLAIEQVVSIDAVDSNIKPGEIACRTEVKSQGLVADQTLIDRNREIMDSGEQWRAKDGARVASETFTAFLKNSGGSIEKLRFAGCKQRHLTYSDKGSDQYQNTCWWTVGDSTSSDSYGVELLKHAVLKTKINSWKDVSWMPDQITHEHCDQH